MNITPEVNQLLEAAVKRAFPEHFEQQKIKIETVEIDETAGEIRITLTVSAAVDPVQLAEGYFGLTGRVRRSLADRGGVLRNFFPIITPSIGQEVHA